MDNTPPQQTQTISSAKKKLLIVEDDFFIRDLYEMQAKKVGLEVSTASDGEEAIEKAKDISPDGLLIDLMIPKIDGINLIRKLKEDPRMVNIPCLIITNLEDVSKEKEAKEAGAAGYLLKIRNTPEVVIENIKKLLN